MGALPLDVVKAWSELEAQYGSGNPTVEQGLIQTTEASDAAVLDEAYSDLEVLEGSQDQTSGSAEQLMELALFSCPNSDFYMERRWATTGSPGQLQEMFWLPPRQLQEMFWLPPRQLFLKVYFYPCFNPQVFLKVS